MRMWSPTDRFNEGWRTLTLAEKDEARQRMTTHPSILLRIEATADGAIVRASLERLQVDIGSKYDGMSDAYRFFDEQNREYLVGAPPVVQEAPVEDTQTQIGIIGGPNDGFGFSAALICLKDGEAVARRGWNADGQFVRMAIRDCQSYFVLYNAQKKLQPRWLPSTGDLFAEDWFVIQND